ncbi:Gfo/Idh/MocA family protein [Membranihabitans maritimus]|uniref:Gfo/Idh/MocA family protein n=1 Tax=Membranihabitans maritimus TaxID=2904244 RepID=UPI001F18D3CA|nr:Gfo/Idh/MocA family oxidoreductase [Membranihabitans maritimus]
MKNTIDRRKFIKNSVVAGAAITIPNIVPARAFGANDRVNVAVLGVNGRGKSHIKGFMNLDNVQVTTLCDPDMVICRERAQDFEKTYDQKVATVQDLREVNDDPDIDVVSIATCNHWHALATIWACQAGKDVYVEKPGSHNIWEGRKMVEAAAKYDRIVQHGVQLRSSKAIREAVQLLRDGYIGDVYMARGLVFRWRPSIGDKGFEPVPEGLDYDLWTGPAPMQPFTRNLVHYNWHWHWDYGNGDVGNQGIHETDLCMWGLDVGLPTKITSMGGKFLWDDAKEVPEVQTSIYHYPEEKKMIQFEVRNWCTNLEDGAGVGNIFYGDKGYMVIKGYETYETYLGREREPGKSGKEGGDHYLNFIEAVRAHDKTLLHGPVETAHLSSGLAHLGNIAYKLGRVLTFDPSSERFVNDPDADKMLTRNYREPYVVPDEV